MYFSFTWLKYLEKHKKEKKKNDNDVKRVLNNQEG